jgi:hypothetical protein
MSKASRRIWYLLLVAGLLIAGGIAPVTAAPGIVDPAQGKGAGSGQASAVQATPDPFTRTLIDGLKRNGFQEVTQGYPRLYTLQDCIVYTYPVLKNCLSANPAAPYVMPVVKSWPDEYVDPATANAFGNTDPGYSSTYRLDPRDAIVIFGEMPPPGRYMSLQTLVFSEHGKWNPKVYEQWANTPDRPIPMQYLFDTVPPGDPKPQRLISASSLGDQINNVVMERKSGDPFGKTRYFIVTPSATTDQAVRRALHAQGVPDGHIFTQPIPSKDQFGPIGPLGMGKNAVDFVTAFRYAVADNADDAKDWRARLPLTVLRVRGSRGAVQQYPSLISEPRTANSEVDLTRDLEKLVDGVCDRLGDDTGLTSADCNKPSPASSVMPEMGRDLGWIGPYCRHVGMDCLVDQQEAAVYLSPPHSLDSGQVVAVIGTLATETGNATYVGLSANDASMLAGVANVLDTDFGGLKGLKGSADTYAGPPFGVKNTHKLFVHYFAKDCAVLPDVPDYKDNCSPTAGVQGEIGDPALRGMFTFVLRDYIAVGTERGPDPSKLLNPRILTFTKP